MRIKIYRSTEEAIEDGVIAPKDEIREDIEEPEENYNAPISVIVNN